MIKINLTIVLVSILLILSESTADKCLFRGKCGDFSGAFGDFPIPCIVDEEPKALVNETTGNQLKQLAPELFTDPNPVFCCDDQQVSDILTQIGIAKAFMNACPSCFVNFAKIFFHMSCNPKHSHFLRVTKTQKSTLYPNKRMLSELTYFMSNQFANNTYNTCADVQFSGAPLMTVMCGAYVAKECSPLRFLESIGKKDPSPIQIDFQIVLDSKPIQTYQPLNIKTVSCAEAPEGYSNHSCSCSDCPAKC